MGEPRIAMRPKWGGLSGSQNRLLSPFLIIELQYLGARAYLDSEPHMSRLKFALLAALFLLCFLNAAHVQGSGESPDSQVPTLTSRSNLVLVPVLVKTSAAKVVLSLTTEDFILTDN